MTNEPGHNQCVPVSTSGKEIAMLGMALTANGNAAAQPSLQACQT